MSEIAEAEEKFLGRTEEQDRFRDALRAVVRPASFTEQMKDFVKPQDPPPPYVFLLYGEGGMGKSKLCQRFQAIATGEAEFKDRIRTIWLDWEERKRFDHGLAAHDAVTAETVFENVYAAFRDTGVGDKFDPYEKAVTKRTEAEKKVAQALDAARGEGQDRYADLRKLGAKGLAWLVRTGLPGGVGAYLPEEPTAKAFEVLIEGGAAGLAHARDTATTLVRAKLDSDEFDLFVLPNETLAHKLADGLYAAAQKKPVLLVLDTYEIVDHADYWLRSVIKLAGPRIIWIISGRHNLADSGRRADIHFSGYREDKLLSKLLRVMPLTEFSAGDVMEYFQYRVVARPLDDPTAQVIQRATLGIPLAVKEAAAIWAKPGTVLNDITGDEAPSRDHDVIVQKMTERFLMHCWDDPKDRLQLYMLALACYPDAELLAAMLGTDDLEHELTELEKRHSFVFVRDMTLHDKVVVFVREFLLADLMRTSKDIRGANQRAVKHLSERLAKREALSPLLEDRVDDERWTTSVIALAYHSFWLDEDDGWKALLPAFVGGLVYDRDFARALLDAAKPLSLTLARTGSRRLKILQAGLNANPDVEQEAALLHELETSQRRWVDDSCLEERRAILVLLRGRLALRRGQLAEAQRQFEETEKGLPPDSETLKRRLGVALLDLSEELMWPGGASDAINSADADRALAKAAEFLPDIAAIRYYIAVSNTKALKYEQAIAAFNAAIALDPKDALPHNGLGNVYRQQNQYEQAIAAFNAAIALDPKDALPHNGLGNVYADQHQYEQAIAEYNAAIALDPKDALPHNGLGNVYANQHQYEQAIAEYNAAIVLDPKLAAPHHGLGNVYADQHQYEQAIAAYNAAIALDPKDALPHNGLGNVYRQQNQYEQAIAEYNAAIVLDPKLAAPHHGLGNVYRQQNQYEQAIAEFNAAIVLDPKLAAPHHGLGNVYRQQNQYEQAIAAFNAAIVLDPKLAAPHNGLGNVYRQQNQYEQAIAAFNAAIALDPKDALPHNGLGNVYADQHQYEQAIAEYNAAIALDPKLAAPHHGLGNVYVDQHQYEQAIAAYNAAIALDPKDALPHNGLGNVYADQHQYEQAIAEYNAAIVLDPKLAAPHHGLGNVYADQHQYEQAIAAFNAAIVLDPKLAAPHHGLGNVYRQQNQYEQAIAEFNAAIALDPKLAAPHHGLGNVYRQQNQYEQAIAAFNAAIALDPKLAAPHHGLGNVYRQQNQYEQAIAAFNAAIALDPKDALPHNGLGNVYADQHQYEQAIAEFNAAIALDPKDAYPHSRLGVIYQIMNQLENARLAYLEAAKLQPEEASDLASLASVCRKLGLNDEFSEHIQLARSLMSNEDEYTRACIEAIAGNADEAYLLLKTVLEKKLQPVEWIRQDPDWANLRDDPRFKELTGG